MGAWALIAHHGQWRTTVIIGKPRRPREVAQPSQATARSGMAPISTKIHGFGPVFVRPWYTQSSV